MFIFQSKFDNPPYRDRITEKSGTSKTIQWDFQIAKVGSLDFLDLKVNGSPDNITYKKNGIESGLAPVKMTIINLIIK